MPAWDAVSGSRWLMALSCLVLMAWQACGGSGGEGIPAGVVASAGEGGESAVTAGAGQAGGDAAPVTTGGAPASSDNAGSGGVSALPLGLGGAGGEPLAGSGPLPMGGSSPTCTDATSPGNGATCESYCTAWFPLCKAEPSTASVYADREDCLAKCSEFSLEQICCRGYHVTNAPLRPSTHCGHAAGFRTCP
jgi:hypothetical protein